MRKKQKNFFKKTIIIFFIIISFLFCLKYFSNTINSTNSKLTQNKKITEQKNILSKKLNKIFLELENKKTKSEQKYIYYKLEEILKKRINSGNFKNKEILNFVLEKIKEKNNSIYLSQKKFEKHNTKIFKFSRNDKQNNKILENFIKKNSQTKNKLNSIFIFKLDKDLTRKNLKNIIEKFKKINKDILIFIDQEGGIINRYVEFEKKSDIEEFFFKNKYDYLKTRFKKFNKKEIKIIRNIFPKNYGYFPSLEKIGKTYDLFNSKQKKKNFLEIIAFIRLKTLKNNGINTYGLVADLNRGNPVISKNKRSFSKHLWKYKELINAFIKASRKTGVIVYLKHFPGHGDGKVDSHLGILDLSQKQKYLKENIELFDYFLDNSLFIQKGLMVGHIYITNSLETNFSNSIKKADFLLTDDLAMQGYKKAKNKKFKNKFFSTNRILNLKKTIIVDTKNIAKIK